MKMSIGKIRDTIRAVRWLRMDLIGGTSEEFRKQNVGSQLEKAVERLKSLEIPSRFVKDIERRDEEISFCLRVIGRWQAVQHVAPRPRLSETFIIYMPGHA